MEPLKRQILFDKKAHRPESPLTPKETIKTFTETGQLPTGADWKNESHKIYAWIQDHHLFKWSAMCDEIDGLDKGNFKRWMSSGKEIPTKFLLPILQTLKAYGYAY